LQIIDDPQPGYTIDRRDSEHPSRIVVASGMYSHLDPMATMYWYSLAGTARIRTKGFDVTADVGTFGACPGPFDVVCQGLVIMFERISYRGLVSAGRLEDRGRLAFMDGCSDTVLIAPPQAGDPVLNHLHIPSTVKQSPHFHTSDRLGVVTGGSGVAWIGRDDVSEVRLQRGSIFCVEAHEVHSFETNEESLDIVVFHPDSDWGPTDAVHPMRTRSVLLPPETPSGDSPFHS
jgi:hypothetical protein